MLDSVWLRLLFVMCVAHCIYLLKRERKQGSKPILQASAYCCGSIYISVSKTTFSERVSWLISFTSEKSNCTLHLNKKFHILRLFSENTLYFSVEWLWMLIVSSWGMKLFSRVGINLVYRFAHDMHNMEEYLCNNFYIWEIFCICFSFPLQFSVLLSQCCEAAGAFEIIQEFFFPLFIFSAVLPLSLHLYINASVMTSVRAYPAERQLLLSSSKTR